MEFRARKRGHGKLSELRVSGTLVESRPAILVFDPREPSSRPTYFMLLDWAGGQVGAIRDFRYAAYAIESAQWIALPG